MLLGSISSEGTSLPCLISVERARVQVLAVDDLARFSWPVDAATMRGSELHLQAEGARFTFHPDIPDRFRWVMAPALKQAEVEASAWWRRRRAPSVRGLRRRLDRRTATA